MGSPTPRRSWLDAWMKNKGIRLWGIADLTGFTTPRDRTGKDFSRAVSWAMPMDPLIMAGIQTGPNQAYADEYARVNNRINDLSRALEQDIRRQGTRALALAASERTDPIGIKGDFPHKTAATRAGLGWIGRHCQLITRPYGSWVRIATVFADLGFTGTGPPVTRHFCGDCRRCVDACPANALQGEAWFPGVPRAAILDVRKCDQWKKEHYYQYHKGHNCGICSAVCPYGLKVLKRKQHG